MARFEIKTLVITCGEDGILAFAPEGSYRAVGPHVDEVNAAAPASRVAALAYRCRSATLAAGADVGRGDRRGGRADGRHGGMQLPGRAALPAGSRRHKLD